MKKTISLKLTSQEEKILISMRNEGISPSDILREGFWKYVHEKDIKNIRKGYKEVNQVNHFFQQEEKSEEQKDYKEVNQVNQKVNQEDDSLREKKVYHVVNHDNISQRMVLDQYFDHLTKQLQQLELELNDWKMRYTSENQYWKEAYQMLQTEYQNQVKDSTKRIDEKFDRIMFYMEESRKSPVHNLELSSDPESEKSKKKWTSQRVRM